ncbi:MAG: DUF4974 domain-containing protein [Odoribacteraceae bacterium]|nr:DUF4974 domain-containing protein [Odoribacteraceae bacterium]
MDEHLYQLFRAYLTGDPAFDPREFARAVNDRPALARFLEGLEGLGEGAVMPDRERLIAAVTRAIRRRRRARRWTGAAAALVVGLCGWWLAERGVAEDVPLATTVVDSSRVRLVLSSGEVVSIADLSPGSLLRERDAEATLEEDGSIAYATGEEEEEETMYHSLVVPRGNEFRLLLSDGTEVLLNSGTEIRYPARFGKGTREVSASGEAFFRVARDSARPFVAHIDGMRVEALGTSFSVNSYRDDGAALATLVEGTIRVTSDAGQALLSRPGQQARLQDDRLTVANVDLTEAIAWINGQFLYNNMPLENICKQLERWYDAHFYFYTPSARRHAFTGVIKRYHSLREILSYIEETTDVRFEINDRVVTVYSAKP